MDDPQLQRAIYASIQTARSQGYHLGSNRGSSQPFRPSIQPCRGGGGGSYGGAGNGVGSRSAQRTTGSTGNRSQPRSYAGNSLPGVGSGADTVPLRSQYGRIDTLRRDGIAPAAPTSPTGASRSHAHGHSHSTTGQPGPSPRSSSLPTAVPPRLPATPPRPRHNNLQRGGASKPVPGLQAVLQQSRSGQRQQQQRAVEQRQRPGTLQVTGNHPVMEAIAAVTAEAYSAHEASLALGITPPSPSRYAPPRTVTSPQGQAGVGSAGGGRGGGDGGGGPGEGSAGAGAVWSAAGRAVGGNTPPPRALVPVATTHGSVVMVPEGVDPVLAQAVLRDAVTWDTGVTFDDIAGCDRAKQLLHEAVALPLIIPEFFTGIREPWRGVLLHGPPGNGKTLLAKAVAGMVGGAFFAVSPASLTSKWRGESEKLLAALFAVAQAHAPAIIFIDEIDALGGARGADGEHEASRRFKAELLQQMDGLASGRGVMVLAATNCPWDLDPALRRRLEKRIHIGLPDCDQRLALLQLHLRGVVLAADVDLRAVAAACEGMSGADIRLLCRDAAMAPLRRQIGGLALAPPQQQQQQQGDGSQPAAGGGGGGGAEGGGAGGAGGGGGLVLRSAADIRRLADSGELARGSVVAAADLEAARGSVRPSVSADQAARFIEWDREFAST